MNALQFPSIEWGDATALVDAIRAVDEPTDLEMLRAVRAPFTELTSTVMTTRATTLGASVGRNFYHHEGRSVLATGETMLPELSVGEHGPDPVWDFGLLVAPKYFSFFQDAPFAAYHPNHRIKWRAHEMLHGAARFFWRPDMTRFEAYLGARLNELLPVVHWYHLDEIDRPRCPDHRDTIPTQLCANCERLGSYWEQSSERHDAVELAQRAFEHFDSEIAACERELESGRAIARHLPSGLEPSSDAIAYMRAHWARLTAYSFGYWAELFLSPGIDYLDSIARYRDHIIDLSRSLFSGPIVVDNAAAERALKRRTVQDLTYRFLFACESNAIDEEPFAETLTQLAEALDTDDLPDALEAFVDQLGASSVFEGVTFDGITAHDVEWVEAGLQSVADDATDDVEAFVSSVEFWDRGTIVERYDRFLTNERDDSTWRMAAAVCALPRLDLEGERFGSVPENVSDLGAGRLRVNDTFRVIDDAAIGYHFLGTFRVVPRNDLTARVLDAVRDERVELDSIDVPTLLEFIESGLVLWFPEAR